jgi:hypothetical protein
MPGYVGPKCHKLSQLFVRAIGREEQGSPLPRIEADEAVANTKDAVGFTHVCTSLRPSIFVVLDQSFCPRKFDVVVGPIHQFYILIKSATHFPCVT